jgi:hypothetical protein
MPNILTVRQVGQAAALARSAYSLSVAPASMGRKSPDGLNDAKHLIVNRFKLTKHPLFDVEKVASSISRARAVAIW